MLLGTQPIIPSNGGDDFKAFRYRYFSYDFTRCCGNGFGEGQHVVLASLPIVIVRHGVESQSLLF